MSCYDTIFLNCSQQTLHSSYLKAIYGVTFVSSHLGCELLNQFLPFQYLCIFSESSLYLLPVEYHIHIWQVLPQLSCGGNWQIWMWSKKSESYVWKSENFSNIDINKQSFINPHLRSRLCLYNCCVYFNIMLLYTLQMVSITKCWLVSWFLSHLDSPTDVILIHLTFNTYPSIMSNII